VFGWVFIRQVRVGERVEADLRKAQEALELIATHDSLTGLGNRRLFERALDIEFGRGARQQSALSLIMIDIDFSSATTTPMVMWSVITAWPRWRDR
jgi:PleD family two-component response regulator